MYRPPIQVLNRPRYTPTSRTIVARPNTTIHKQRPTTVAHTTSGNIDQIVHMVTTYITFFTFSYCTLNWMYYKRINDEYEKDNKKK